MRGALATGGRIGLALALVGGLAFAQDTAVKKPRRPQPPTTGSPADAASSSASPAGAPDASGSGAGPSTLSLRGPDTLTTSPSGDTGPAQGAPTLAPLTPAPPALRSAIRSRWDAPATIASRGGGVCRAQCAETRIACLAPQAPDDAPRCNAQWTSCLSACDGLTYGRAPSP